MYYLFATAAIILFGGQFFFNGIYEQECGASARSSLVFVFFTGLIGTITLFVSNGFRFGITPFTLLIAFFMSVNSMLFSFFAIKSLGLINLSLFSVFSMIGGMTLPFVVGIMLFNEKLTVAKSICFILTATAMSVTVDKNGKKGGWLYYSGVFITNGMSGVYSMIFQNLDHRKASAADLSIVSALLKVVLSGAILAVILSKKHDPKPVFTKKVGLSLVLCGVFSIVANYLLLIALKHIPGSMQYPMVTGGVMIVSTVIGFFTSKKPKKKDILSFSVAFLGLSALLLPF